MTPIPAGKNVWWVAHSSGAIGRCRPTTSSRMGWSGG